MAAPSKDAARRGGLKSAQRRRERAEVRADLRAKTKFEHASEKMADILIRAALGMDEFAKLEPKDRAQFALKVLEYGVGRPRQTEQEKEAPEAAPAGLKFTIGGPQGDLVATPEDEGA